MEQTTRQMIAVARGRQQSADGIGLAYAALSDQDVHDHLVADLVEAGMSRTVARRMVSGATERMARLARGYADVASDLARLASTLEAIEKAKDRTLAEVSAAGRPRITIN